MKRFLVSLAVLALLIPSSWAGVEIQLEARSSASSDDTETETLFAQGEMIRMDTVGGRRGEEMSMIFRDQTMWFLDHGKKVAQKIDEEGMEAISAQMNAAMKQMESMPAEQRAMMEKMMKGRMPGMGAAQERRFEKGGSDQVGKYACTVNTLYAGERKVWEACTAPEGAVAEMSEAMGAFRAMAAFAKKLQDAVSQGPFASMVDTPYNDLDDLEGFPVRTRMYDRQGKVTHETVLKSVTKKNLESSTFEIPDGYKVKDLRDEMGERGRGRGRGR